MKKYITYQKGTKRMNKYQCCYLRIFKNFHKQDTASSMNILLRLLDNSLNQNRYQYKDVELFQENGPIEQHETVR